VTISGFAGFRRVFLEEQRLLTSKLLSGSVQVLIGEQGVCSRVSSGMMPAEPTNEGTPLVAPASTRSRSARAVAEIGERLCLQHTGDTRPLWHVSH
jgi:hypothetical protein